MAKPTQKGTLITRNRTLTNDPAKDALREGMSALPQVGHNQVVFGAKAVNGGEPFTKDTSRPVVERLDLGQKIEKAVYIKILTALLHPQKAANKSTPERDAEVLRSKLEKTRLEDFKKFFEVELPLEVREAIQAHYQDMSI